MLANKALSAAPAAVVTYVEDVFSTYLYTGNGSTQTITNNIDLSGEGGLVWIKNRDQATSNQLYDTVRGTTKAISSDQTAAESTRSGSVTAFNADGFSLGNDGDQNANTRKYVSWTFRKAEKFFDVVTYTGQAGSTKTINHNLGSVPGCIIVKSTTRSGDRWFVWHRSISTKSLILNSTAAQDDGAGVFGNGTSVIQPTSTQFTVANNSEVNDTGQTYVAYLFAHDAGGFGESGSDNVISCGSFTTDGSGNATVTLDWEPQWVLLKSSTTTTQWIMLDTMRGWTNPANNARLFANLSNAESSGDGQAFPTATGFGTSLNASQTFIYIAIRRGPMKTPTSGTSVYNAIVRDGTAATATITGVGFPVDLIFTSLRPAGTHNPVLSDRLRGAQKTLSSRGTQEEQTETAAVTSFASMDGVSLGADNTGFWNGFNSSSGSSYVNWFFKRAPGFFDVVCYTGTGSNRTVSHNLGVAPELMLVKRRNTSGTNWIVYANNDPTDFLLLNLNNATFDSDSVWNDTSPTSTNFTLGTAAGVNASGDTYVAYLFASVSGVSKVGTYTGNGSSVTVTTNFQPRFILVKRTDSTGDWIVSDSARGLVAGNDPYLELNTSDAEDTDEDWVDITSTSFTVNQTTAANANVNTGTYIYLAIA
jgi:hypothetical protein